MSFSSKKIFSFTLTFVLITAVASAAVESDVHKNVSERSDGKYKISYSAEKTQENMDRSEDDEDDFFRSDGGSGEDRYFGISSPSRFFSYNNKFPKSDISFFDSVGEDATPDQILEMVLMRNAMKKLQGLQSATKRHSGDSVWELVFQPKIAFIAGMFPFVMMLAFFVPILLSYFNSSSAFSSTITTIASSKMARSLTDREFLESALQEVMAVGARIFTEDECLQKAVCELLRQNENKNIENAASIVKKFGKVEWLQGLHIKDLVDGLSQSDCSSVCQEISNHGK